MKIEGLVGGGGQDDAALDGRQLFLALEADMQFQVEVEVDEGAGQGEVGKMLDERGQHGEYP